jgi:nucleotide-binding universal stress UspA family protein
MRILLATDGSEAADTAGRVVGSTRWPVGSTVRVVAVARRLGWSMDQGDTSPDHEPVQRLRQVLDVAERELGGEGRHVEAILLDGRPASAIVDEAETFEADLVVVGSRGHGPWQSRILGSVSAEVVDHAPCPVLVVRTESLEPMVFGDDGSEHARRAEALLSRWPHAPGTAVTVLSVVPTTATGWALAPGDAYTASLAGRAEDLEQARADLLAQAEATAGRLRASGLDAHAEIREGDPAGEIVAAVQGHRAGLVVLGTRGHGGIARLLLGSVARNVLLHAPCSVLITRPAPRRVSTRVPAGAIVAA